MDDPRQLFAQAQAALAAGRTHEAEALDRQLIQAATHDSERLYLAGVLACRLGRLPQAAERLEAALAGAPQHVEARASLAFVCQQSGDYQRALAEYRQAIEIAPHRADLQCNFGSALHEAGRLDDAVTAYCRALELDPSLADAHYNLANLLRQRGQLDAASQRYQQALLQNPAHHSARMNLAHVLLEQGHPEQAQPHYRQLVAATPQRPDAHYYLGLTEKHLGNWQAALDHYQHTIELAPQHAAAHYARALIWLQTGDWSRGWAEYAWRWRRPQHRAARPGLERTAPASSLLGKGLAEKTILVASEQGVEHDLLFGTCLPELIAAARHVLLECDPRLVPLFRRTFPAAHVRARETWGTSPPFDGHIKPDAQIGFAELGRLLRPTADSFSTQPGYLLADPERLQQLRERMADWNSGLKVGVAWRNAEQPAAPVAPELAAWLPLLSQPGVHWVNLQAGSVHRELAQLARQHQVFVHDWDDCDLEHEFDTLAARIAALDLVIAAPGPAAHLAAALGIPTWVVVPAVPSWFWGCDQAQSPWYPTARIFRSTGHGQLVSDLAQSLAQHVVRSHVDLAAFRAVPITPLAESFNEPFIELTEAEFQQRFKHAASLESHDAEAARQAFRDLLEHSPRHPDVLHRLGMLTLKADQRPEAIDLLTRATQSAPCNPFIRFHLAVACSESKRTIEAADHLRRALRIHPDFPEALMNMGAMLERLGRLDESLIYSQRAVEMNPKSSSCAYNLGNTRLHLGNLNESLRAYTKSLALDAENHRARWNSAMVMLLTRRFAEGWEAWESREAAGEVIVDKFKYPVWDGSSLADKKIFIHAEQGIGDEVMFASCFGEVLAQARQAVIGCDPRLLTLFTRSFPTAQVLAFKRPKEGEWKLPDDIDVTVTAGGIPRYLRSSPEQFPRQQSFLVPDPRLVAKWQHRLAQLGPGLKVGISWRAGGKSSEQRRRTSELENWLPLLNVPGVQFVNLQYGNSVADLKLLREKHGVVIHDWPDADPIKDLENFAAQVSALDLVISVGNTTIHFAGALGIPTWTMLPHVPGWRYMIEGEDLLWYRSVRLFRQPGFGDWQSLVQRMADMLRAHVADHPSATSLPHQKPSHPQTFTHDHPSPHRSLLLQGVQAQQQSDFATAERCYQQVLEQSPHDSNAWQLLGTLNDQIGRHGEAITMLQRSLQLDPLQPHTHYNLAGAHKSAGRISEAIAHYRRAIELKPTMVEALLNLGAVLHQQGDLKQAVALYHRALDIRPTAPQAHYNLALVLQDQGHLDQAADRLERAAQFDPLNFNAWVKLAALRRRQNRLADAAAAYARAIELEPNEASLHWNRALALLSAGQFAEGWQEWEWRGKTPAVVVDEFPWPLWKGESLAGKQLLVHAEQAIGDEILFASCLPDVIEQAARVIVTCDLRLGALFQRSFPQAKIYPRLRAARTLKLQEKIDLRASIGSLPAFLRPSLDRFPTRSHYLRTDSQQLASWQQRLAELPPGLRVGIAWRAGTSATEQQSRTAPLALWHRLLATPGLQFINLQYGDCAADLENIRRATGVTIHDWTIGDPIADFDQYAARIAALDLVIAVGSTATHLAGALGVETWALVPFLANWRYTLDLPTLPWYAFVRQIRQPASGDWAAVMAAVQERIQQRLAPLRVVPRPLGLRVPHITRSSSQSQGN
jgi:tetratricopeptide (TPR) repeat protein/ADP-heptose:LPS heptosyltransferase